MLDKQQTVWIIRIGVHDKVATTLKRAGFRSARLKICLEFSDRIRLRRRFEKNEDTQLNLLSCQRKYHSRKDSYTTVCSAMTRSANSRTVSGVMPNVFMVVSIGMGSPAA